MSQPPKTPDQFITDLSLKMQNLVTNIGTFITALQPVSSDPAIAKLIADLNQPGAQAFHDFLTKLSADLEGVETGIRLVQAYLQATKFMDQIDVGALGISDTQKLKSAKDAYQKLRSARKTLRDQLTEIRDDEADLLTELLKESAKFATAQSIDVAAFIAHLRNAREILRQLKRDNIDLDDDLIAALIDNWMLVIQKLPEPNSAVQEEGRRGAVAQTIDVHNLLEAIYDLLAQDVSLENPFDLVSL